jgi:hypothetical protein
MSRDDDRPGFLDREKKSFSERDRLRRERRGPDEKRATSPAAQARIADATKQYLKQIDSAFAKGKGGAAGEQLAQAVRDARGTPGLAAACHAYRDGVGPPTEPAMIACFLDAGEAESVLCGLEGLRQAAASSKLVLTPGLRTQLRMLAQDPDDGVASAAEELLALA